MSKSLSDIAAHGGMFLKGDLVSRWDHASSVVGETVDMWSARPTGGSAGRHRPAFCAGDEIEALECCMVRRQGEGLGKDRRWKIWLSSPSGNIVSLRYRQSNLKCLFLVQSIFWDFGRCFRLPLTLFLTSSAPRRARSHCQPFWAPGAGGPKYAPHPQQTPFPIFGPLFTSYIDNAHNGLPDLTAFQKVNPISAWRNALRGESLSGYFDVPRGCSCSSACLGAARPVSTLSLAAEELVLGTRRPIGPAGV
jgi:hypothetical protein